MKHPVSEHALLTQPLVSVLLPVYNGGAYLAEAIESILSQTYLNLELIVINDGSTDGSAETIKKFADPRIRLFHQKNQGLADALNRAVSVAFGAYLARQDADDVSFPDRIDKQVRFLENNADYGMVGTWSEIWEEQKKTERGHRHPCDNNILAFNLLFDSYFVHSSVMIRKSVFDMVGLYSVKHSRQPEDFELWSRILRNGRFKFANIPEVLVSYRELPHSICRTASISFVENVATFCVENLAWAACTSVTDSAVNDIAALIHNVTQRLSTSPDLNAMQIILRKAFEKAVGPNATIDADLLNALQNRIKTVSNRYYCYRYGPVRGRVFKILAELFK
jgi:glycosyltransferase involved in cell wall biosynthesis